MIPCQSLPLTAYEKHVQPKDAPLKQKNGLLFRLSESCHVGIQPARNYASVHTSEGHIDVIVDPPVTHAYYITRNGASQTRTGSERSLLARSRPCRIRWPPGRSCWMAAWCLPTPSICYPSGRRISPQRPGQQASVGRPRRVGWPRRLSIGSALRRRSYAIHPPTQSGYRGTRNTPGRAQRLPVPILSRHYTSLP